MEESVTMEAYELQYCDLMLLSSEDGLSSSLLTPEIQRLGSITRAVMESLGPAGPGLIAVVGVPNGPSLRRDLLPLARRLALLDSEDRKSILKKHGLGSDVPLKNLDRTVSSFAMQLKYAPDAEIIDGKSNHVEFDSNKTKSCHSDVENHREDHCNTFNNLASSFKELGFRMIELGIRLARICDSVIGGQELEQSLLESCSAKGRLIHYHSRFDNLIVRQSVGTNRSANTLKSRRHEKRTCMKSGDRAILGRNGNNLSKDEPNLWQQWHYDYGIFTVLTAPMFLPACDSQTRGDGSSFFELRSPSNGHTCLQIFDSHKKRVVMVKAPPESFIVQVGESADILSKGKLQATLHSVSRLEKPGSISRETFVVFLQPSWSKKISLHDYPLESFNFKSEVDGDDKELDELTAEIQKIVPPLCARIRDGMTFADFSKETTKQYYGGSGLQSKR